MPGHFEKGIFIEEPEIDTLANAMLMASYAHFQKYNELHPPGQGVIWMQSTTGFMVICTSVPKYADQLKRFLMRLK
jgi:hypothetical protein